MKLPIPASRHLTAVALAAVLAMPVAFAVDVEGGPADPALRARYEAINRELRCLVCQNQSIADSDADLAKDLRHEVRNMLEAGSSDAEIRSFMTDRYGDFVLYKPPVNARTWLLWAAPVLLLGGGLGIAVRVLVRRTRALQDDPDDPADAATPDRQPPTDRPA
jgi:cytochrome c-type biogenesis protein CcmH